jgi:hypothetical protein
MHGEIKAFTSFHSKRGEFVSHITPRFSGACPPLTLATNLTDGTTRCIGTTLSNGTRACVHRKRIVNARLSYCLDLFASCRLNL